MQINRHRLLQQQNRILGAIHRAMGASNQIFTESSIIPHPKSIHHLVLDGFSTAKGLHRHSKAISIAKKHPIQIPRNSIIKNQRESLANMHRIDQKLHRFVERTHKNQQKRSSWGNSDKSME